MSSPFDPHDGSPLEVVTGPLARLRAAIDVQPETCLINRPGTLGRAGGRAGVR